MFLLNLYDFIGRYRVMIPRLIDSRRELHLKKKNFDIKPLSSLQRSAVKEYWGGIKINTQYLSLYNEFNSEFDPRYVPDDLYYGTIDVSFNNALHCAAIDDKNLYDLYFSDVTRPRTIVRKINGSYQDEGYNLIDEEEAIRLIAIAGSVCIKNAVNSNGGKGVEFWDTHDGKDALKSLLKDYSENLVIQKRIVQHENIAKLHPQSVNSIRVLSFIWEGGVQILSSIIRIGNDGNKVDNGHSGGIFVGIDDGGRLKNVAYNYMSGQRFMNCHPTTNAVFTDCVIPNFEKVKETIKRIAPRLVRVSRLTSWDFSVDENGVPVLIEVNMAYGGLFFHQIANGPVFGDRAKEIVDYVLSQK